MPPGHIDHHSYGSDLYLKVTPISDNLVKNYEYAGDVHFFRDQIEHALWYEIPFAYLPYWENLPR